TAGAELVAAATRAAVPGRIRGAAAVRGRDNTGAHATGARRGHGSAHGGAALCPGGGGSALERYRHYRLASVQGPAPGTRPAASAGDVSSRRGDCAGAPRARHGARTPGARLWGRTGPGGVVRSRSGRVSGPARGQGGGSSRTGTSADSAYRWSSAVRRGARG